MNINPSNILMTLLGGLFLAALLGWIRKPRLIVLVPKLFSYSALSTKGQLAEISIFNRGFKTEELIELELELSLQYELVGKTNNDARLLNNKISIPRIGPGDDVTILLLVEGANKFTQNEIIDCLSKESKGIKVPNLTDVPPTGSQRIQLVGMLVVLPIILYLGYQTLISGIDTVNEGAAKSEKAADESKTAAQKAIGAANQSVAAAKKGTTIIRDWSIKDYYSSLAGILFIEFENNKINVSVGRVIRKKDVTTIPISIENLGTLVIKSSITMNSQWSEGRISSSDLSHYDVLTAPGSVVTKKINVIIPLNSPNANDKKAYIDIHMSEAGGDSLNLNRVYIVE